MRPSSYQPDLRDGGQVFARRRLVETCFVALGLKKLSEDGVDHVPIRVSPPEPTTPHQLRSRLRSRSVVKRRLAAILGADIRGYSILMAGNEEDTHQRVGLAMGRLAREIQKAHGNIFSDAGDGLMAEFPSAVEALRCALRIQADAGKRNAALPPEQRIEYRMGINAGEVVLRQGRAGGNVVNVAARLEQIADPGGIFISSRVFEQVSGVVTTNYESVGERRLKNIPEPVKVYRIPPQACQSWISMSALPLPLARPSSEDYRPSLAVLPFLTLGDVSDSYFARGMVDDIIRLLGGLKELLVIERSSTLGFCGSSLDLRRIVRSLLCVMCYTAIFAGPIAGCASLSSSARRRPAK